MHVSRLWECSNHSCSLSTPPGYWTSSRSESTSCRTKDSWLGLTTSPLFINAPSVKLSFARIQVGSLGVFPNCTYVPDAKVVEHSNCFYSSFTRLFALLFALHRLKSRWAWCQGLEESSSWGGTCRPIRVTQTILKQCGVCYISTAPYDWLTLHYFFSSSLLRDILYHLFWCLYIPFILYW